MEKIKKTEKNEHVMQDTGTFMKMILTNEKGNEHVIQDTGTLVKRKFIKHFFPPVKVKKHL